MAQAVIPVSVESGYLTNMMVLLPCGLKAQVVKAADKQKLSTAEFVRRALQQSLKTEEGGR